jgi:hypothetical protein
MAAVQNRSQRIERLHFFGEGPVVHTIAAKTWMMAWTVARNQRVPRSLLDQFRASMRVRALLAVQEVRRALSQGAA